MVGSTHRELHALSIRSYRSAFSFLMTIVSGLCLPPCHAQNVVTSVAGYYTANDSYEHAITATDDGRLHETYFDPKRGKFHDDLGCYGQIVLESSFYSPDDGMQHALVLRADGSIRDAQFSSSTGMNLSVPLITLPSIVSISAFYADDDKMRILLVATSNGDIHELYYDSKMNIHGGEVIFNVPNLTHIAGFYADDDKMRHIIVTTRGNDVLEVKYSSQVNPASFPIENRLSENITSVAAFYTPDDKERHAIVALDAKDIFEIYYDKNHHVSITHPALASMSGVQSIGAYYTPFDKDRHVIVGLQSGEIRELFYNPSLTGTGNDLLWQSAIAPTTASDWSPDAAAGPKVPNPNPSGLTEQLAGDESILYAVTLDAGIASSVLGGPWTRIPNSPRYAYSLAIDPKYIPHLVVGERKGDAIDPNQDGNGLWETTNNGQIWTRTLDPLTQGCPTQDIPAVVFTAADTLIVATTCGIARREANATTFTFPSTAKSFGAINAVVVSDLMVWARTDGELLWSLDDGKDWTAKAIPPTFTFPSPGDRFSLAAFDGTAYMTCCKVMKDGCQISDESLVGNWNQLLIYNVAKDQFFLQPQLLVSPVANPPTSQLGCDGTGGGNVGGTRFVRTFEIAGIGLQKTHRLFYGSGQEIYEAASLDSLGEATQWTRALGSLICGTCAKPDQVHSDFWDFLLTPDAQTEFISNDGGVYSRSLKGTAWSTWTLRDNGLHTHHIHSVNALLSSSPAGIPSLAYPTSDNGAWYLNEEGQWKSDGDMGDANWSVADTGNPNYAVVARTAATAALIPYGQALAGGQTAHAVDACNNLVGDGPESFNFIQSPWGDIRTTTSMDAIMLANLPLQWVDKQGSHPVPGSLGQAPSNGGQNPVLLRNTDFAANPDINTPPQGTGWSVLSEQLPSGTTHFWVSGGHSAPTFFYFANQGGTGHLFKSGGSPSNWIELNVQGKITDKKPWPDSQMVDGSETYGPVFVNPYDPSKVYVLTETGVRFSDDGGLEFDPEPTLTNLISGNNKYPIWSVFSGGNSDNVRVATRAVALGALADMDFRRDDPRMAVVVSPFSGVFFKDKNGKWHDLTSFLPTPLSSVLSARISCDAIYVGTEGGGITRIANYENAP